MKSRILPFLFSLALGVGGLCVSAQTKPKNIPRSSMHGLLIYPIPEGGCPKGYTKFRVSSYAPTSQRLIRRTYKGKFVCDANGKSQMVDKQLTRMMPDEN